MTSIELRDVSRFSSKYGVLGAVVATGILALLFDGEILRDTWATVGATYLLVAGGGSAMWRLRNHSLDWVHALLMATVAVLLLIPATSSLFVEWGETTPTLARQLSTVLPLHLQRIVPVAFMFPLAVAQDSREQFTTAVLIVLPSAYELLEWFVLRPEQFSPFYTTPVSLVASTLLWLGVSVSFGGVLFSVGRMFVDPSRTPSA